MVAVARRADCAPWRCVRASPAAFARRPRLRSAGFAAAASVWAVPDLKQCGKRQVSFSPTTPEATFEEVVAEAVGRADGALGAAEGAPTVTTGLHDTWGDGADDARELARSVPGSPMAPHLGGATFVNRTALLKPLGPITSAGGADVLSPGVPRHADGADARDDRGPRGVQGSGRLRRDCRPQEFRRPRERPSVGGPRPLNVGSGEAAAGGLTQQSSDIADLPEECRMARTSHGRREALLRELRRGASQSAGSRSPDPVAAHSPRVHGRMTMAIYDRTYSISRPARHRGPCRSVPAESRNADQGAHGRRSQSLSSPFSETSRYATLRAVAVPVNPNVNFNDAGEAAVAACQPGDACPRARNLGTAASRESAPPLPQRGIR